MAKTFKCTQCGPGSYWDGVYADDGSWVRQCRCCGSQTPFKKRKVSAKREKEQQEVAAILREFMQAGGA
jgi:NAD-dependent SIR2 family protein deacetylase